MPVPFLQLPLLAIDETFKAMVPYQLFGLSTLSKITRSLVKSECHMRKFNLTIRILNYVIFLDFNDLNATENYLSFLVNQGNPLNIPGETLNILGNIASSYFLFDADHNHTTRVSTCWTDIKKGTQLLIEYLADVFDITNVNLEFKSSDEKLVQYFIELVKRMEIDVVHFTDLKGNYTFKRLDSLMPCKQIWIDGSKLSNRDLKSFLDKYIENSFMEIVCFRYMKQPIRLEYLARRLPMHSGVVRHLDVQVFMVSREDGSKVTVTLYSDMLIFRIFNE